MTLDAARFQKLLDEFELESLFNELGWDRAGARPWEVTVNGEHFTLRPIGQKRGVVVFLCAPDRDGNIPPRATLLKIEKEAAKLAHEHLLIFADAAKTTLTWLWVARAPGQPTATRTHTWRQGQSGESLRQKLEAIVWSLEAEEAITLTDVITGLRRAFDRDRVTRAFYDRFQAEHQSFSAFIQGLASATDQAWYASLMLNRLMFVYFIQRKGFLDGNAHYLADRLRQVQAQAGRDRFHSFYRLFLRRLFHEGLGRPKTDRAPDLSGLIGEVPYLNGGLFDLHELEEANPDIDIPDEAFERLFRFFDGYDWHLDDRPLKAGNEINPDVLGYIFEKYINQKQMGAYYTKEDITGYIAKNTVIPHLLERARERCKVAFEGEASVWNLLQENPDRYLYPAMKTGVIDAGGKIVPESALPDFVQTGMRDAKARMFDRRYNLGAAVFSTATGERGTLPTETWREYVERRTRCLSVRGKLAGGEVKSVDDLVTLNLDIRQFMQDVIDACASPDLLRAVWQAIVGRVPEKSNERFRHGITILDPTCGSGAFLFAALNILESLYEGCLDRMEGFVEDARKLDRKPDPDLVKVLAEVEKHPSRRYFIYKSVILHNLFGVDLMAEAVEICKLRLFLKLVSQVDSARQLEPLPDIDFNIRCGNTLVGYATEAQFDAANNLASDQAHRLEIKASIADLADLFDRFREQQTQHGGQITSEDKRRLREKLNALGLELDRYLARDYGVDSDKSRKFTQWRENHQPFHWFAEFYGVMQEGGFDVVIGNPPYIEYSKVRKKYQLLNFETLSSGNLYALATERAYRVMNNGGHFGFIVQAPIVSTLRMSVIRSFLRSNSKSLHFSTFDDRPSKLFEGMHHCRLAIVIATKFHGKIATDIFSTCYHKWNISERGVLFQRLKYVQLPISMIFDHIPKIRGSTELALLHKISVHTLKLGMLLSPNDTTYSIYYKITGVGHWFAFTTRPPRFWRNGVPASSTRESCVYFSTQSVRDMAFCLLCSTFHYWFYQSKTNCRDFNPSDIATIPIPKTAAEYPGEFRKLADNISEKIDETCVKRIGNYAGTGTVEFETFQPKSAKEYFDQIDLNLARHYGFDDEQTDFIINYDIKYRMGGAEENE